jgi:hypothetical protein
MSEYGYGLWGLVAIDSLLVLIFAVSFFQGCVAWSFHAIGGSPSHHLHHGRR